jgi:phenylpropionate dioxygenase-like ring-hydroxylating dioxygenase large terminal subunit
MAQTTAQAMQDDLTLVGPGTTMGRFMREYWVPAAMSSELTADGDPLRLRLLGEELIAFRDSSGAVGVMDHRCPHRNASLFLGRNEEGGIRCVYHGWKFAVDGRCLDQGNVRPEDQFCDRVRAQAYPTVERNGLVWAYLGPRAEPPPLPMVEVTLLPASSIDVQCVLRDCNWLQAMEGDIDTSHFGFLHAGHIRPEELSEGNPMRGTVTDRAPRYHVRDTPWGTSYGAYRPGGEGQTYWRFANFLFPFWTQQPQGPFPKHVHARAWVPLDDHHTMFINVMWKEMGDRRAITPRRVDGTAIEGLELAHDYLPNTTDSLGRWRLRAGPGNDWLIDRAAQHEGRIYTGISNIHLQDQAVTESMGPITDFSREHLSASDQMIARTRRRILAAARAFRDDGATPPGVDDPEVALGARSGFFLAEESVDWLEAYDAQVARAERPAGLA